MHLMLSYAAGLLMLAVCTFAPPCQLCLLLVRRLPLILPGWLELFCQRC